VTCVHIREPEACAQDSLGKHKQKNPCRVGGVLLGFLVLLIVVLSLCFDLSPGTIWAGGTVSLVATQVLVLLGCLGGVC